MLFKASKPSTIGCYLSDTNWDIFSYEHNTYGKKTNIKIIITHVGIPIEHMRQVYKNSLYEKQHKMKNKHCKVIFLKLLVL